MKALKPIILSLGCGLALLLTGLTQPATPPPAEPGANNANPADVADADPPPPPGDSAPSGSEEQAEPPRDQSPTPESQAATPKAVTPSSGEQATTEPSTTQPDSKQQDKTAPDDSTETLGTPVPNANGEQGLRLNFRGAPLEMVLNYLSEAAGFIIVLETEVKGKLDVWSNQPLTKEEAIHLLNRILNKNGYAAIRDGRTLTIVSREDAKRRDIPVKAGNDPEGIPKNDQIITQIIPVRFISAVQLARDLQPLVPTSATIGSNEGGNALVITDTQTNIRHMTEIIRALDTSISSVSSVRVFPLQFADAKALATVVKDLFTAQDSNRTGNQQQQQQFFRGFGAGGFGRGGGGGGGGGGNQGGDSSGSNGGRVSTPRITAVADERSNALVVSAPEEQMPIIEDLVKQVDVNVDNITELRVFHLKYADPQETADLLTSLFPDDTKSNSQNNGGQFRFGGGGPFAAARQAAANASAPSSRTQQKTRVTAVPDLRTGSIVVSASRDLIEQIAGIVEQLDSDPAKKQKVYVYSVENTDPQTVEELLRGLFETQDSRNRTSSSRNSTRQMGTQLNNRATQQMQNQGGTGGFGGGGNNFGGSGGGVSRTGR